MRKNIVRKKFHEIYSTLSGRKITSESKLDFHMEDQYYERFYVCEMLNAYFAGFSIIFGIIYFESDSSENSKLFLYLCTIFSILLWLNIILQQLMQFAFEKNLGIYLNSETLISSGKFYKLLIEVIITIFHPNPAFEQIRFSSFNDVVNKDYSLKYNDIFLILSFLRFYYILRLIIYANGYLSTTTNRLCKTFFFYNKFPFALKSALASNPIIYLSSIFLIVLFSFAYCLKIFEREIQPPFNNFWNCLWEIIITFPTVGYGDYTPKSPAGRAICIISSIFGVFFDSMMVVTIINLMKMNKGEKNAQNILDSSSNYNYLKESAKKVINVFRKISQSKYNLMKTVAYQTKNYFPLRNSLNQLNVDLESNSFNYCDNDKEMTKMFITLSCIMKSYENIKNKHDNLDLEFMNIKGELLKINQTE